VTRSRDSQTPSSDFSVRICCMVAGCLLWGTLTSGVLNQFTSLPHPPIHAMLFGVVATFVLTAIGMLVLRLRMPARPMACFLYPAVPALVAVLARFSNNWFYGW